MDIYIIDLALEYYYHYKELYKANKTVLTQPLTQHMKPQGKKVDTQQCTLFNGQTMLQSSPYQANSWTRQLDFHPHQIPTLGETV